MTCFPNVWAPTGLSFFSAITSVILAIVIISGNTIIIAAVVRDPLKRLRTPFNFFLVNLAVCDFLVGAVTMPVSVSYHLHEAFGIKSTTNLTILHVSYFISATASVLSLASLSVDRYCAIRWPIRYRHGLSIRRCGLVSALIWILSIAVSMTYFQIGFFKSLMIFIHIAVFGTFVILLATFIQVDRAFKAQIKELKSTKRASDACRYNQLHALRAEKKVTRAFLWILGCFIASYTPAAVMIYVMEFCTSCNCYFVHSLRDLTILLVSANSGMNPFICAIRLKVFRKSIASLPWCCKKRSADFSHGSGSSSYTKSATSTGKKGTNQDFCDVGNLK